MRATRRPAICRARQVSQTERRRRGSRRLRAGRSARWVLHGGLPSRGVVTCSTTLLPRVTGRADFFTSVRSAIVSRIPDSAAAGLVAPASASGSWMADMQTVQVGVGPVSFEDVVAVAREGAAGHADRRVPGRGRPGARRRRGARRGPAAGVRHLDRLRSPGDPAHPDRAARAAPAIAGPLACRRLRPRGRARGGPRADAAPPVDACDRPDRRTAGDGAAARLAAECRDHAGGPRVRLARLLRRPGARWRTVPWR